MSRTITDLRGYTVREPEQASTKSKLLAATAVILGVVAIGAYAYTSQSLLPSAPASQKTTPSEPIPLTPSAPAMSQPQAVTPPVRAVPAPEVLAPTPEIKAAAPQSSAKARPSERTAHVKARAPVAQPQSSPAITPPDTTQVPATPSQTVTPDVTAPGTDTTTPYTAAPATTEPQTTTPDNATNNTAQPQTTPEQSAPQTPQ